MNQITDIAKKAKDRFHLWVDFVNEYKCVNVCEIGVYKGEFAEVLLKRSSNLENYYMIDPWRNLSDWNKPANTSDNEFELYYNETIERTKFAEEKITIFRGKTLEVINNIENESLDFVYIDGDHTLKGITIDLLNIWGKVKRNGFIAGDDFCPSIWQHSEEFEPTLVFPFAVYFAEAMKTKITALPYNQFLISKEQNGYEFVDLTNGKYKIKNLNELINRRHRKAQKNAGHDNIVKKIKNRLKKL